MAFHKYSSEKILRLVENIKQGSNIDKYSMTNESLIVEYKSGRKIKYSIDQEIQNKFEESNDKNKFIISKIVGKHPSEKIKTGYDEDSFDQLLKYMEQYIKSVCKKYYLQGKDQEDIVQEARISLYNAARDYSESKNVSFENFAIRTCVRRRIFTEIDRSIRRQKSIPLNTASSLDAPVVSSQEEHSSQTICDLIESPDLDPLQSIIDSEEKYRIRNFLDSELTQLESAVLDGYEHGDPYREIAEKLAISVKCVDNSLGRIRKKANRIFSELDTTSISTVIYRSKKRQ